MMRVVGDEALQICRDAVYEFEVPNEGAGLLEESIRRVRESITAAGRTVGVLVDAGTSVGTIVGWWWLRKGWVYRGGERAAAVVVFAAAMLAL